MTLQLIVGLTVLILEAQSLILGKSLQNSLTSSSQLCQSNPTQASVSQGYSEDIMNTYSRYPLTVSHGKGTKLYDVNGKEYLDCTAGIATSIVGHANPTLKKAICEQLDRVNHCSNLYFIPQQAALGN